jgi:hypothetical protein
MAARLSALRDGRTLPPRASEYRGIFQFMELELQILKEIQYNCPVITIASSVNELKKTGNMSGTRAYSSWSNGKGKMFLNIVTRHGKNDRGIFMSKILQKAVANTNRPR